MAINEQYRKPGTNTTPVGYEVGGRSPIDGRLVLASYDALKQPYTEVYPDKNIYNGMTVTVVVGKSGKPELYTLSNFDDYVANKFDEIEGATDEEKLAARLACWTQVSADSDALEADIADAISGLTSTTNGSGTVVTNVTQSEGKVTVTKGDLASAQVTATAVTSSDDTVAIDGTTVDAQIKSLGKTLKTVQDNAAKYTVVKLTQTDIDDLTDADKANIKEAYQVVSYVGDVATATKTPVGEAIKIYKDSALKSAELDESGQKLVLTYTKADGTDATVEVDFTDIVFNAEFKDGLVVNESGEVRVKVDATSEGTFLTVGEDGLKLSGVQDAINDTVTTEIAKLDANVGSTTVATGKHVAVQVVETDGKLTSVTVTEDDIASASDLTDAVSALEDADDAIKDRLDTLEGDNTVAGSVKKTVKDAIDALGSTTSSSGTVVTDVTQTNGKVTVTKGDLASTQVTAARIEGDSVNSITLTGETVAAQTAEIAAAIKAVQNAVDAHESTAVKEVQLNGTKVTPINNSVNLIINGSVINWSSDETKTIEAKLEELAASIDTKITALDGKSVKRSNGKLEVVLGEDLSQALEITDNGLEWKANAIIDCGIIDNA